MELHQIYQGITATPFKRNRYYKEYEPCDALKPYVFGEQNNYLQQKRSKKVILLL